MAEKDNDSMSGEETKRAAGLTRRTLIQSAAVAGAAVGTMGPSIAKAQERSVTFGFWGDPAEETAYLEVIKGFEEVHPEIKIQTAYTAGKKDFQTKLATSFAAGNPPDVFLLNYRRFGQYAARGALEVLQPYFDNSTVLDVDQFYEEPMDAFRYRGGDLVCVPQNVSSLVTYVNTDLFDEFGVPVPYEGWSLDEFVEAALKLTHDFNNDGVNDIHGLAVDPSIIRYAPFIWGNGGKIVDDIDNPTTLTLDTPEALEAINWFISLGQTGYAVTPTEAEVLSEDDQSRFMNGRAAMFMQSRRAVPSLREIKDFNWDVVPLPAGKEPFTILHSDAFCMTAQAADKEAAWQFIEYAVSQPGQEILAATGRTVPSMRSVAESDVFLKGTTLGSKLGAAELAIAPANSQVYLDNVGRMSRVPSVSTWPEIEDAINTPFKRAFYVEIDIPDAIEVATFMSQDAFQRALDEENR